MAAPWLDRVRLLAEESAAERGLDLFDVETRLTGRRWWLRVTLDRVEGTVSIEDCVEVSRALSLKLDAEDAVPHAYELEVSSPGVERPLKSLKDFERFRGKKIHVVMGPGAEDAGRAFDAVSLGAEGEVVLVQMGEEVRRLPMERIKSARLVFEFP
jgi:ribosome maturation factor RimP